MISAPRLPSPKAGPKAASRTDASVVAACLSGEQAAWNDLVDRYSRLVYSIPRRYGLSAADADDVFQSVFLILFRRLAGIRDAARLSAWLIRTTHRECCRIGTRSGRYVHLDENRLDFEAPAEEDAGRFERQQLVRQALRQLGGPAEQLLVALFPASGKPNYESIARRLGMKAGSIGPTRARLFRRLEKILAGMGVGP